MYRIATGKTTANLRFLNRNFEEAVQRMGISLADSQVPQTETSLWTQRLFGLFSTPQQSQAFACWQLKAVSGEAEDCILSRKTFCCYLERCQIHTYETHSCWVRFYARNVSPERRMFVL